MHSFPSLSLFRVWKVAISLATNDADQKALSVGRKYEKCETSVWVC